MSQACSTCHTHPGHWITPSGLLCASCAEPALTRIHGPLVPIYRRPLPLPVVEFLFPSLCALALVLAFVSF